MPAVGNLLSFGDTLKNTNIMLLMMGLPPCEEFYPGTVLALLRQGVNFLEVTFQVPRIGYCIIGVLKMVILAVRRNTIAELVELFRTKWEEAIANDEHRQVCEKIMRPAIRVTSFTALANVVMGIAFTMLPIAEMIYHGQRTGTWTRQLAFNIWWPFDPFGGAKFVWAVYPLYVVIGFTGIIIHMAFDCLFCILAAHQCMQFRIHRHNTGQLVEVPEVGPNGANVVRLQDAIVKHQDLIGCSAFMQNVFGNALFINFLGSSIIICIQAFMITSGDIADAAYDCRWYEEDESFRMSLLQVLHTAQQPVILTAWKILQASWSYFTLLKTVNGDK